MSSLLRGLESSSEDLRRHALLAIAHSHYRAGRCEEAEAELLELLVELPERTLADDARRDLGWCLLASGDATGAEEEFMAVASLDGDSHFKRPATPGAEAWAHPLNRSATELREGLRTWYRQSPRSGQGLDPLVVLIALADREAAAEVDEGLAAASAAVSP